jgi:hypothetical protein
MLAHTNEKQHVSIHSIYQQGIANNQLDRELLYSKQGDTERERETLYMMYNNTLLCVDRRV